MMGQYGSSMVSCRWGLDNLIGQCPAGKTIPTGTGTGSKLSSAPDPLVLSAPPTPAEPFQVLIREMLQERADPNDRITKCLGRTLLASSLRRKERSDATK